MEFNMRETPPNNERSESVGPPASEAFSSMAPEPTELPFGGSALEHVPERLPAPESRSADSGEVHDTPATAPEQREAVADEEYYDEAECRAADLAAAAKCAEKPRLLGGFVVVEGYEPAEPMLDKVHQDIKRWQSYTFKGESKPAPHEQALLARADNGIDAIGTLINVEIAQPQSPVRMFGRRQDFDKALKKLGHIPPESGASYAVNPGLFLAPTGDAIQDRTSLIHERIHQRSSQLIEPQAVFEGQPQSTVDLDTGYPRRFEPGSVPVLTETVTDMAVCRIVANEPDPRAKPGYLGPDLLLEGIITETADTLKMSEQDIEFALYRGMFGDDYDGIAMIRDAIGPERTDMFLKFGKLEVKEIEIAAHLLRLPDIAAYAKSLARGTANASLFDWQPHA